MLERSNGHAPGVQRATALCSLVKLVYTQPTKPTRNVLEEAVQIRTAGVRKCRSLHIVYHGLVNIREQSKGHNFGVQVEIGPLSLVQFVYTQPDGAARSPNAGSCTDRHSKCTKYRSLQIVRHAKMNCREPPGNRTHGVHQATAHPSLVQFVYTQPNAALSRPTSESCSEPYSRCMKMPFTAHLSQRPSEHV